jgi:hypothetical protein
MALFPTFCRTHANGALANKWLTDRQAIMLVVAFHQWREINA